jgi:predicted nucleotidyltransferase
MKTREDILKILRDARRDLQERYHVTKLALFGSYARGDQREDSDIDILVDVDPSIGLRLVTLADELESLLGSRVELVTSRAVSPKMIKILEVDSIEVA